MADDNQNQQFPTDPNQEYHFKSLVPGSAAYPGPALPGYRRPASLSGEAQRRQAASDHQAKEAAHQAKHDAQARKDAAPPRKRGKK